MLLLFTFSSQVVTFGPVVFILALQCAAVNEGVFKSTEHVKYCLFCCLVPMFPSTIPQNSAVLPKGYQIQQFMYFDLSKIPTGPATRPSQKGAIPMQAWLQSRPLVIFVHLFVFGSMTLKHNFFVAEHLLVVEDPARNTYHNSILKFIDGRWLRQPTRRRL